MYFVDTVRVGNLFTADDAACHEGHDELRGGNYRQHCPSSIVCDHYTPSASLLLNCFGLCRARIWYFVEYVMLSGCTRIVLTFTYFFAAAVDTTMDPMQMLGKLASRLSSVTVTVSHARKALLTRTKKSLFLTRSEHDLLQAHGRG